MGFNSGFKGLINMAAAAAAVTVNVLSITINSTN
jgi:hypothetical protein